MSAAPATHTESIVRRNVSFQGLNSPVKSTSIILNWWVLQSPTEHATVEINPSFVLLEWKATGMVASGGRRMDEVINLMDAEV